MEGFSGWPLPLRARVPWDGKLPQQLCQHDCTSTMGGVQGREEVARDGGRWRLRCARPRCRKVIDHVVLAPDGRYLPSGVVYGVPAFGGVIRPPQRLQGPPLAHLDIRCDQRAQPGRRPRCSAIYRWNLDRFAVRAAAAIQAGKDELIAYVDV